MWHANFGGTNLQPNSTVKPSNKNRVFKKDSEVKAVEVQIREVFDIIRKIILGSKGGRIAQRKRLRLSPSGFQSRVFSNSL